MRIRTHTLPNSFSSDNKKQKAVWPGTAPWASVLVKTACRSQLTNRQWRSNHERFTRLAGISDDINVLSAQRVNRAALPVLRQQGKGLLVWVSSTSTRGGTPPYLAPYFAAKAGMDALAVSYAGELARWNIETTIIVPGAFTSGTNHFAHAGSPQDKARLKEYESGPTASLAKEIMKGFEFDGGAGRRCVGRCEGYREDR
jgi:NAD(P)-dependent dehydrogenase (short-subunit alcohol dehydrogenase family)